MTRSLKRSILVGGLLAGLLLSVPTPASAQGLYLRNRPYSGKTTGYGRDLNISLADICKTMELQPQQVGAAWIVGSPPASTDGLKGVWVNGHSVSSYVDKTDGQQMVSVREFAYAAKLHYALNRELGTIEVTFGANAPVSSDAGPPVAHVGATSSTAAPPLLTQPSGQGVEVNAGRPGTLVDIDSLPEPGRLTVVLLYRDYYTDPAYQSISSKVDGLVKNPKLALFKINFGAEGSPLRKAYPGMSMEVPHLLVYNRPSRCFRVYDGQTILSAVHDANQFFKDNIDAAQKMNGKPLTGWKR